MKRLLQSCVEAGNRVKAVRQVITSYENQKQDQYDDTAEILKPTIDAQKAVKKTIDEKQDEVIEQLQKNQLVLTQGIDDMIEANKRATMFERELPQIEEPAADAADDSEGITILNIDNNFNKEDKIIIDNYKLLKPKDFIHVTPDRLLKERWKTIEIAIKLGGLKRRKNTTQYDKMSYDIELQTMRKYRETIADVLVSMKYRPQTAQQGKGHLFSFYDEPEELLSRLELLGGSLSVGNNSETVREEFANIVHMLNKLNMIDNKQMNNLMKEYLI